MLWNVITRRISHHFFTKSPISPIWFFPISSWLKVFLSQDTVIWDFCEKNKISFSTFFAQTLQAQFSTLIQIFWPRIQIPIYWSQTTPIKLQARSPRNPEILIQTLQGSFSTFVQADPQFSLHLNSHKSLKLRYMYHQVILLKICQK